MKRLTLKAREERRLLRGHLWAYRNEFESFPDLADGDVVDVMSDRGRFVGRGFYQAEGGIAVRLLSRAPAAVDIKFFAERIDRARRFRDRLYPGESVYRWVFGESDGLPGLVADRYGPLVSAQASGAFYEGVAEDVARAFLAHEGVEGVRLAVASGVRTYGDVPRTVICDINGLHFSVDPDAGQKTGLYLDQRENWTLVKRFASGARVFDGHCYTGAWSCHAASYGAQQVLGVDTSKSAVEGARRHAEANGLADRCTFECVDVREALGRDERYDVAILDPPALAKSRRHASKALGLYQSLNRDAMAALVPGGILITSSCSHFVDATAFLEALKRAANSAQRQARVLEVRGAAPDHPVMLSMPETGYLTCVVLEVD